jgi:hypothetical protein
MILIAVRPPAAWWAKFRTPVFSDQVQTTIKNEQRADRKRDAAR